MNAFWYYIIVFSAGLVAMIAGTAFQEWWVVGMGAISCAGSGIMIHLWFKD